MQFVQYNQKVRKTDNDKPCFHFDLSTGKKPVIAVKATYTPSYTHYPHDLK